MREKKVHVRPSPGSWMVIREGSSEPISTHGTQPDAIIIARTLARADDVTLVIHNDDDSVRNAETFRHD